jgi:hypothetical protein
MIEKYPDRTTGRRLRKIVLFNAALTMATAGTVGTVGAEGCLIKEIKLEKQENHADSVVINMTGCPAPKVSGLEGPPPRIVLDFPAGCFQGRRTLQMDVSGGSVVKIRGAKHDHPLNMFRIVLDLKPRRSYGAEQTWLQGEDKYIIKVAPETPASP